MAPRALLTLVLIAAFGCEDDALTKNLEPTAPPPPPPTGSLIEVCDGLDNDGDGDVDEGWDSDGDGTADCHEMELCNGLDDNGDGRIDEGFDVDADGTADCYDTETCDGVDNDGDGAIDEGFDADDDGTADCFDTEVCDGVDNDGDGERDEGFDADGDGLADCRDTEECDGMDNDGAGAIDEGFDVDGDGTADCFDREECDGVDNDGDGEVDEGCIEEVCNGADDDGDGAIDEGFDVDGDGVARCCEEGVSVFYYPDSSYTSVSSRRSMGNGSFSAESTFAAVDGAGQELRILGYGDIVGSDRALDLLWYRLSDRAMFSTTCLDGEWQSSNVGTVDRGPRSWGDVNRDGCLDYISYDYRAANFGGHGDSGDGFTYLGDCTGQFRLARSRWNVRFLSGFFTGSSAYNLRDFNGDGNVDAFFWAVSSGGTTPSRLWYLPGDGRGSFGAAVALPQLNQAGNYGAMGDVDGDGCVDWVNGSNDDGTAGSVWAVLGDCAGGVHGTRMLVDQGRFASANGQGIYGDGQTKLFDFDGDGDLDLVTSFNRSRSGGAAILYWANDGSGVFTDGSSTDPDEVIVPMWSIHTTSFLSPLP